MSTGADSVKTLTTIAFTLVLAISNPIFASTPSYDRFQPGAAPAAIALEGSLLLNFSALPVVEISSESWLAGDNGTMPVFKFTVVADDGFVIPVKRGLNVTDGIWDYVIGVGRSWNAGNKSIASVPLTLIYRSVNCAHNGAIRIEYDATRITRAEILLGQETCHFKRVDVSGTGSASYEPHAVPNRQDIIISHRMERSQRIPVHSFDEFSRDHPTVDFELFETGLPKNHDLTTHGFYYQGKHYNGGCTSRFGAYPFCSDMLMTSFSTAKTAYAGLALMAMAEEFGMAVYDAHIDDLLPETAQSKGDWTGVTLNHVSDMATGNFAVRSPMADADPGGFYYDSDRAHKLDAAFNSPNAEPPGKVFIYQTADTFIQVAAMDAFLRLKGMPDSFEYLVERIYRPLGVQPDVLFTRRTSDDGVINSGTAFGGMGLFWTTDSAVKIARFMMGDGKIEDRQVVHPAALDATMQRDPNDRGMDTEFYNYLYNNNMWGIEVTGPAYSCKPHVVWMSGLSGVRIIFMPNGLIHYYFNDAQAFPLAAQIQAANKLAPFCEATEPAGRPVAGD
jgi:hypothetical protein